MPSRKLDDLDPRFQPIAFALLARFVEVGLPVLIVCTRRSDEEQAEAVRTHHSKVAHSLHQDGLAIDIVPYSQFDLHGPDKLQWDTDDAAWPILGAIGEKLGLRWGGRFKPLSPRGIGWDPGHFEYVVPSVHSTEVA